MSEIGLVIAAQSERMVPADKLIYALRDATATVESIPLIASSVMSKKLAVGADAIVLDVKAGSGAFMPAVERARELAQTMADIGARAGKRMVALVTRMEQPLGTAVGDAAELAEAVATLAGRGPADLVGLCEALAGHMLVLGGAASSLGEGQRSARRALDSGAGLAKLRQMVAAQGGSPEVLEESEQLLAGVERVPVEVVERGVVAGINAREIGLAIRHLKAAAGDRARQCGVLLCRKVGEPVTGDPVAVLLAPPAAPAAVEAAVTRVRAAFHIGESAPAAAGLVAATITA